ncbi:hypothetical protein OZ411_01520 [Bradyrhizobium sp. Arg237L]|uniref:hypothetical protein n=1 Tax=Bradyrhizobium sp. Arg237L TaxID=3003352 RepID=UPI00249E4147|nr:hypothetical protein [Bradyrhizobium sp. Arg237L]MDI4231492.1 hypothetical protein [Bradyrhizobium sp. Arg237L]
MSKEFELARLAIVRAVMAGDIDEARGFAWAHRIYPLRSTPLEEAFADDFHVSREKVDEVLRLVDSGWRKKNLVTFYDLEGVGSEGVGLARMDLVAVLRTAYLDRRFHDDVWRKLVEPGSGPVESQGLADKFSVEDDISY